MALHEITNLLVAASLQSRYIPLQRADRPTRKGAPVYRVEGLRKEAFGYLGPIRAGAMPDVQVA